jgi:palmitoyltransferase
MDHHCPWTSNCVSHRTFPTFLRFLHFTTTGLSLLQYLLLLRLHHLWVNRHLPSSLGPPTPLLFHLFFTLGVNSITLFAVGILAVNNTWALLINTTTIESWEISRHATLVRRARRFGGYLRAPGGEEIKITHQEFPFDVGIWSNICQGMGSRNPLTWLNPFAAAPETATGLKFDENGFEDPGTTWPPPDPDRGYKRPARAANEDAFVYADEGLGGADSVKAFKARQDVDAVRKRKPFVQRLEEEYAFGNDASDAEEEKEPYGDGEGEEGWRNSEGECLKDFGLDEDVEFYDEGEDEIPLGELLARRRAAEQVYEE